MHTFINHLGAAPFLALNGPLRFADPRKTLKQLDSSDLMMRYAIVVVSIGEALGFDSAAAFDKTNRATGNANPAEGLTVAAMQTAARTAYFAGTDSPPPPAPQGATFKTRRFSVTVPNRLTDR